ncbi:MAG: hypothetical protein AAB673_03380, partial [Patescibacteria group bacterium]
MTNRFKQIILLITDWGLLYLALFLALFLRYREMPGREIWRDHWPLFSLIFLIWLAVFFIHELYNLQKTKNNLAFFRSFLTAVSINVLIAVGFFYLINSPTLSPKTILLLLTAIYIPLFVIFRLVWQYLLGVSALKNRLLFLGLTAEALELIRLYKNDPQLGYNTVAVIVKPADPLLNELPAGIERFHNFTEMLNIVKTKNIDTIVLALPTTDAQLNRLLYESVLSRINIVNIDSFYETITHRVPLSALRESWFLENLKEAHRNTYDAAKRVLDVACALVAGMFFAVIFLPIIFSIWVNDRGSIFYKHTRVGRDGK